MVLEGPMIIIAATSRGVPSRILGRYHDLVPARRRPQIGMRRHLVASVLDRAARLMGRVVPLARVGIEDHRAAP